MAGPCLIYDDPRPVQSIWFESGGCFVVGHVGAGAPAEVTRIVAYKEHGEGDFVPWLAVYCGDHLHSRVPGRMVQIVYAEVAA